MVGDRFKQGVCLCRDCLNFGKYWKDLRKKFQQRKNKKRAREALVRGE